MHKENRDPFKHYITEQITEEMVNKMEERRQAKNHTGRELGKSRMAAIDLFKSGKAERCDEIPVKLLKNQKKEENSALLKYTSCTGKWPDDFTKATIVTIVKKMNASECAYHSTINMMAHK